MSDPSIKDIVALDAMGNDAGPEEMVQAVKLALPEHNDIKKIILVGDEAVLKPLIDKHGLSKESRIDLKHASEVIGMDEKPIQSIKQKKDSSLVRAIELVKEGHAGGVLSCGNTGSLMAASTIKLRPAKGIDRPAIGTIMPSKDHHFTLIDAGANPESEPINLVHNAILGSHYCRVTLNCEKPRVGLLTIGTEEGKGNELVSTTHDMLKKSGDIINYQGLIEGFQVFENHVDVVVCDGFVGNIVLKISESLFYVLKDYLKEELMKTPIRALGALLSQQAFKGMKSQLNPERYGGAPFLGLNGVVMKSHGSSNMHSIKSALGITSKVLKCDMNEAIKIDIEQVNKIVKEVNTSEESDKSPALK